MGERTLYILVVGPDTGLHEEVTSAAEALLRTRSVVLHATALRDGVESARNRNPDLVVLELGGTTQEIQTFTNDIQHVSPESAVVGAYKADGGDSATGDAQVVAAVRSRVRDFLRRPVSSTELQDVIDRCSGTTPGESTRQHRGVIVDFVSNKGGVGKSTTSINAACLLAKRHPGRVLLIDASLQLGVCASSLDLTPATTIVDAAQELARLDETLLREIAVRHESGLHVLAAPHDAVEATRIGETEFSRILSVARRAFDYVIIDTFPLVDALAVAGLDVANLVYCVTSDPVPNVIGMARYITVLDRLGVTRQRMRVILNYTQPRFPGALTPQDVATRLNRDVDHVVPFDQRVLVGLNMGIPYSLRARSWYGFGKAIKGIVDQIETIRPTGGERPPANEPELVGREA